ncbi:MAG: glycine-rich protein [Candidatus Saccharimonadales bacterium]
MTGCLHRAVSAAAGISSVSPNLGHVSGGTSVVIKGEGFGSGGLIQSSVVNYGYTGAVQTYTAPRDGVYKLETWGAQGGNAPTGLGGYSVGAVWLTAGTVLYLYAGGQGSTRTSGLQDGGFNGGGGLSSNTATSRTTGGGASDVRIGTNSLYARVIVAGGGSGTANSGSGGGAGGGSSGVGSSVGTQIAGGSSVGTVANGAALPSFGVGGYVNSSGGGGGGWYGGGTSGGGSGWVYTAATFSVWQAGNSADAAGWLLNPNYYLRDAQTIAGNASMPNPSGGTMTGRTGDGYVRITAQANVKLGTVSSGYSDCVVASWTDTEIRCTTTAHSAGLVDVVVETGLANYSLGSSFTYYDYLGSLSMSPVAGTSGGGTIVRVSGANIGLQSSLVITFDKNGTPASCTNIVVIDANTVSCVTSAHTKGLVGVTVDTNVESVTLQDAYTYVDTTLALYLGGSVDLDLVPTGNTISSKKDTATVVTNNPSGYILQISMVSSEQALLKDGNDQTNKINPATTNTLGANEWGISLTNVAGSWMAVPTLSSPYILKQSNVATADSGEATDIWYGAKVGFDMAAGSYTGKVVITAVPRS